MKAVVLRALDKKILFHTKKLALSDGKAAKELKQADKETELTPEERRVYDLFLEYESVPLLKSWAQ